MSKTVHYYTRSLELRVNSGTVYMNHVARGCSLEPADTHKLIVSDRMGHKAVNANMLRYRLSTYTSVFFKPFSENKNMPASFNFLQSEFYNKLLNL